MIAERWDKSSCQHKAPGHSRTAIPGWASSKSNVDTSRMCPRMCTAPRNHIHRFWNPRCHSQGRTLHNYSHIRPQPHKSTSDKSNSQDVNLTKFPSMLQSSICTHVRTRLPRRFRRTKPRLPLPDISSLRRPTTTTISTRRRNLPETVPS